MNEKCSNCGSTDFAIVRDMTSRRTCKCGHSWECPDGEPFDKRPIQQLTLVFPHGASAVDCQRIVQHAERTVVAGVSEGGMTPIGKYGIYSEDCKFSENEMLYILGHDRRLP